jgi:plastocyanin
MIVPAMIVGFIFARRKMFVPYHKLTMTTITIVNWILIIGVMIVTYSRDIEPQLPQNIGLPSVLIPTLHLIPGAIAQLLATYLVIRMWFENQLPGWFKVNNIKLFMRTTLALWLTTVVLGVLTWAVVNKGFLAPAPAAVPTASANSVVIKLIGGNKFDPAELSIPAGTTVQFVNADTRPHTVTADDGSFDSGSMKAGATFSFTFNTPGDIDYYCDFHGGKGHNGMSAVLHVTGEAVQGATQQAAPAATQAPTEAVAAQPTAAATQSADAGQGQAAPTIVKMTDDNFEPKEITVTVGTVVRFQNDGKHRHTVTADDGSFDSDQVQAGAHFDLKFDKVGDVALYCSNHGDKGGVAMSMIVHVKAAGDAAAAPAATQATAATTAPTTAPAAAALSADQTAAQAALFTKASDTPANVGYVTGLQSTAAVVKQQAAIIPDALKQAHYEDALAAAEAILNVVAGGAGKDLDADGKINQPGDGFGLQKYVFGVNENANTLEGADALKASAQAAQAAGRTVLADLQDLTKAAQALIDAKSLVAARAAEPTLTAAAAKIDTDITAMVTAANGLK